jgi:hypothetical protein
MSNISVILNVYKRGHTLERQIEAIKNQTIKVNSENIHVWYNIEDGVRVVLPLDKNIKTYQCSYNTKFWGRFTIPLICRTQYIAMFDDDIIPGPKWLENCLNNITVKDGILGGSGVITNGKTYKPHTKVGWNGVFCETPTIVDLVGHAWFFKQEYAKFMWEELPPTWENGEDMFFSYIAQKHGIPTYVPPHPVSNKDLWSNLRDQAATNGIDWGNDANAHSLKVANHLTIRDEIVKTLITKGWKTIKGI